ncbi:MAG: 2Fe-2S iron-sulfur cluster binding domain-containing protein [Acidobacteriota bacterium]|nr:2Fe-2S iron-sulfur cluster binding domain-containing protein [Acidobacteriota bacterium]
MEAELKFEREERNGVVAVGTYLFDAARRLGIGIEAECGRIGECDTCAVRVKSGDEFLSGVTEREKEHLTSKRRKNGERLACQVKIEMAGEIVIMTHKKKEEEKPVEEVKTEEYRKEFEALPLEKKIASLLELEAIALGETFSFVLNSPSHIVGKIMDVMAEFGLKLEDDDKKAKRPKEHKTEKETEKTETVGANADETAKAKRQPKKAKTDETGENQ